MSRSRYILLLRLNIIHLLADNVVELDRHFFSGHYHHAILGILSPEEQNRIETVRLSEFTPQTN